MYQQFRLASPPLHSLQIAGASSFHINNPGGPVSLNPQPLPPRVYVSPLVSRAIIRQ